MHPNILDVAEFEDALAVADRAEAGGDIPVAREGLEAAATTSSSTFTITGRFARRRKFRAAPTLQQRDRGAAAHTAHESCHRT